MICRPAGRLHIRYHYSAAISSAQTAGGNVIDIGIFDPQGTTFPGGAGFRGWSGSARQEFMIGPDDATPGYQPGPLPAGRYQIILGLYRIWPQGAEYTIEITAELTADRATAQTAQRSTRALTYPPQANGSPTQWLRGDLQSHTYHSDAKGSPEQLVAKARALGLDFLAVTDHNTISHQRHLPALADADLLLIPSQEVTTYYGHMNVWGAERWCDFRCQSAADLAAIIDLSHASGGVCSINHPKQGGPAWEYGFELPVDTMEVWQGPWPYRNEESLALWDRLLREGRQIPAVGGSDYHCPSDADTNFLRLGQPTTWVKVREHSITGILEALCAGRACISAGPSGPRLDLMATVSEHSAGMGETLPSPTDSSTVMLTVQIWHGAGYELQMIVDGNVALTAAITADETLIEMHLPVSTYVRAEVVGNMPADQLPPQALQGLALHGWRWALSNPIYLQRA
ncbi:MAG: CehA/McbA family metallohydrolase [Caldilineaceae bacterium]